MIQAWRIVKTKHASGAFSGEGARLYGGRWNRPGRGMVYTAGSTALALLEMLIHLEPQELLKRYALFSVSIKAELVTNLDPATLPKAWWKSPPAASVQRIGTAWLIQNSSAVLRVPSAIVPNEWNYLLNPAHPDFAKVVIGPKQPVQFDPRLLKRPKS
ncbi:MAG: RES family NAD+ phosphorylase [Phycisphaerae bacterium]